MINSNDIHPMMFLRSVPFGQRLVARKADFVDWEVSPGRTDFIMDEFERAFGASNALSTHGAEYLDNLAHRTALLSCYVGRFHALGRNLFYVSKRLTTLLRQTELRNVQCQDLRLPFDCFYVHMAGCGLEMPSISVAGFSSPVTGFYVSRSADNQLGIYWTTRRSGVSKPWKEWFRNLPMGLNAGLNLSQDALEIDYQIEELASKFSGDPAVATFAREAFSLVVNLLCYFAAVPTAERTRPVYPDDAPRELVASLTSRPAKSASAAAELLKRGFSEIRLLNVERDAASTSLDESGADVLPHWRRGHWRRQPHGPGLQQIRLVWIRPTIVRSDKGQPGHGHIYEVG